MIPRNLESVRITYSGTGWGVEHLAQERGQKMGFASSFCWEGARSTLDLGLRTLKTLCPSWPRDSNGSASHRPGVHGPSPEFLISLSARNDTLEAQCSSKILWFWDLQQSREGLVSDCKESLLEGEDPPFPFHGCNSKDCTCICSFLISLSEMCAFPCVLAEVNRTSGPWKCFASTSLLESGQNALEICVLCSGNKSNLFEKSFYFLFTFEERNVYLTKQLIVHENHLMRSLRIRDEPKVLCIFTESDLDACNDFNKSDFKVKVNLKHKHILVSLCVKKSFYFLFTRDVELVFLPSLSQKKIAHSSPNTKC